MWEEIFIKTWDEFSKIVDELPWKKWIFRGQRFFAWRIESSLGRAIKQVMNVDEYSQIELQDFLTYEREMRLEFESSYHLYTDKKVARESEDSDGYWTNYWLEMCSVMQHHGTPTRLIDWTYSPYVATFFAIDGADDNFSVFALNLSYLARVDAERFKGKPNYKKEIFFGRQKQPPFMFAFEPQTKNERLRKQMGLFLVPNQLDLTIDEMLEYYNLRNGKDEKGYIQAYKFIFDKQMIPICWRKLRMMAINHETLYPGLDGFCKSLALKLFEPLSSIKSRV
jgi:hypothetical protein